MLIGPEYEERLKRVLEDRAKESVFADPLTFPRPKSAPRALQASLSVEADRPERGVYEDSNPPAGSRVFKVVSSRPGEVGIVIWPKEWVTPRFIEQLERGLEMRDPQKLRAI